jgi:hypothetical protein
MTIVRPIHRGIYGGRRVNNVIGEMNYVGGPAAPISDVEVCPLCVDLIEVSPVDLILREDERGLWS